MKIDSGASGTYLRKEDEHCLLNLQPTVGPTVTLPDHTKIHSNTSGDLPLPILSSAGAKAHVFPQLRSASLLSVGQLCNDNCEVKFTKDYVKVFKNNEIIISGLRNQKDGLWDVPIPQPSSPTKVANVIIKKDTTNSELIPYFQGCCFSPSKSTF